MVRMPHCSAASMALARMRSTLTRVGLGVARGYRLQPRNPELHRLLHHVVEPRVVCSGASEIVQVAGRTHAAWSASTMASAARSLAAFCAAAPRSHSPSWPLNAPSTEVTALASRSTLVEIIRTAPCRTEHCSLRCSSASATTNSRGVRKSYRGGMSVFKASGRFGGR